ncbi:MAG: glycosyltransferase family 9 protein [Deltaproteobacteria bacterium]|nr:glycosyltransferase family 9 protein [Deltaproteobacteria bacterium]
MRNPYLCRGGSPPRRLFLVRTHAIGDVLLTTAALRALKKGWPQTQLVMVTGDRSGPALAHNPYLDNLLTFPESWWFSRDLRKLAQLTRLLSRCPKDGLIMFHASSLVHLWGLLLRAPRRVGFWQRGPKFLLTRNVPLVFGADRYLGDIFLDLVRALGLQADDPKPEIFLTPTERQQAQRILPETLPGRWLIGVAPGGGQNPLEQVTLKQWPPSSYIALLKELAASYPATFLLLGDRRDQQVETIYQDARNAAVDVVNLRGQTGLRELMALIGELDLLITNDSSPLHIATALNTPLLALFGPTAAGALFLPGPHRRALQSSAVCSPCYPFGRAPQCPQPLCMPAIPVDSVSQAVSELLAQLGGPGHRRD